MKITKTIRKRTLAVLIKSLISVERNLKTYKHDKNTDMIRRTEFQVAELSYLKELVEKDTVQNTPKGEGIKHDIEPTPTCSNCIKFYRFKDKCTKDKSANTCDDHEFIGKV